MKIFKWLCIFCCCYWLIRCWLTLPFLSALPTLLLPETHTHFVRIYKGNGYEDILFDTRPDCIQTLYNFSAYSEIPPLKHRPISNQIYSRAKLALSQFYPRLLTDQEDIQFQHHLPWPRPRMRLHKQLKKSETSKKNRFYDYPNFKQIEGIGLPYKIFKPNNS